MPTPRNKNWLPEEPGSMPADASMEVLWKYLMQPLQRKWVLWALVGSTIGAIAIRLLFFPDLKAPDTIQIFSAEGLLGRAPYEPGTGWHTAVIDLRQQHDIDHIWISPTMQPGARLQIEAIEFTDIQGILVRRVGLALVPDTIEETRQVLGEFNGLQVKNLGTNGMESISVIREPTLELRRLQLSGIRQIRVRIRSVAEWKRFRARK